MEPEEIIEKTRRLHEEMDDGPIAVDWKEIDSRVIDGAEVTTFVEVDADSDEESEMRTTDSYFKANGFNYQMTIIGNAISYTDILETMSVAD